MAAKRVERLRDLVDLIERLPVSPERDRVLSEVRARAVDVDTGVTPRAMLPLREPAPAQVRPRPPKRDRAASIMPTARSLPAGAVAFARPASTVSRPQNQAERLGVDERLSLEDSLQLPPLPHVSARGGRAVAPWTLGLRA
jgi:hypothetical protein